MPFSTPAPTAVLRRARRPPALVALLVVVGAIGAGCGSDAASGGAAADGTGASTQSVARAGNAGTTSTGAPRTLTASEKAVKFAACMRAHGVRDFPDPNTKGSDAYGVSVTPAVFSRAVDACRALKPPGALSSKLTPRQQSAALRFAACVRDHGVKDFPDPVSGQPLINTYKIPSSDKPGGMTILNAATHACAGILKASAGGQG